METRSIIHDGRTTRCEMTGRKTGYEPSSDQDHITVYLGLLKNHVSIHGHLYVVKDAETGAPAKLLPESERWKDDNGRPGRNPELWTWTNRNAEHESESYRRAVNSNNWNRDREVSQSEKRNRFHSRQHRR